MNVDQLYSTASYLAGDLSGINFTRNDLSNGNFAGQILANTSFEGATLTDADFTGADIRGAKFSTILPSQIYSTASYHARDLRGIKLQGNNLAGANFTGQNLAGADFTSAALAEANFAGADIRGAKFSTISPSQIYSTASYQARDLTGAILLGDLTGANFVGQNLLNASFDGANLTDADFMDATLANTSFRAILTRASFVGQTLTNASFSGATLTDADFSNADVRGTRFDIAINSCTNISPCLPSLFGTGVTPAQLYTTASYQTRDLRGINLARNNLAGANFVGRDLTGANFEGADVSGTDFQEANLAETTFKSANLTNANLAGQNLANVDFFRATLTNAEFSGAEITGANFGRWLFFDRFDDARGTGIALSQLYSTASYKRFNLRGVGFHDTNLSGADFSHQDLTYAVFAESELSGASFHHANVTNADFQRAVLTGADFTAADARGAPWGLDSSATIGTNLIQPDGQVTGLELGSGDLLVIRDYDGFSSNPYGSPIPPLPISVDHHFTSSNGGTLRMVFEANAWDSRISFADGIPVALGGTLELTFADEVNLASQVGRTLKIFDWTDVSPTGSFTVASPYTWDVSRLYSTGEVTLTVVPEFAGFPRPFPCATPSAWEPQPSAARR